MAGCFVVRYWRGGGPLWRAYWLYGVLGSLVLTALIAIPELNGWFSLPVLMAALAAGAVYTVWIVVSIWRCAFNIDNEPLGIERDAWAMLARWLTVAWVCNVMALSILLVASHLDN